jgi:hypothetical protein
MQSHRAIRRCGLIILGSTVLLTALPAIAGDVGIRFSTANFPTAPAINDITNPYLPLPVGRVWTYRSESKDGCEENRVEVLSSLKSIAAGVTAHEVHDVVYEDPDCTGNLNLIEDTIDWYAQDNLGNVWYLGEDTKDCDGASNCTVNPGSWEAGADIFQIGSNGIPGIIMLAEPRKGDSYSQEFYEGHAEDVGAVVGTDIEVALTRDDAFQPQTFDHCLKTKERSLLEPGSTAHKFYCPGIGLVAEQDLSRGHVSAELVDPGALALKFRTVPKRQP